MIRVRGVCWAYHTAPGGLTRSADIHYYLSFRITPAGVVELVDTHGSGPCGGNPVEVQVLSPAPILPSLLTIHWYKRRYLIRERCDGFCFSPEDY